MFEQIQHIPLTRNWTEKEKRGALIGILTASLAWNIWQFQAAQSALHEVNKFGSNLSGLVHEDDKMMQHVVNVCFSATTPQDLWRCEGAAKIVDEKVAWDREHFPSEEE